MKSRDTLITTDIDFTAAGLQRGVLRIPYSSDRSAYGYIPIPLWVAHGGTGPTVLLTGANHGDEYEGPVALMRLFHEGIFEKVNGRLIVIPALNVPAYLAGTRTSPIDRVNLNRAFPGKRDGTVTEMLAHYIETVLLPLADYAIDLHSGGLSLNYLPTLITYAPRTAQEGEKLDLIVRAFNPPRWLLMDLLSEDRVIGAAAQRSDTIFVSGEFGGGATIDRDGVQIVVDGLKGVLAALGIIEGASPRTPRTVRLQVKPGEHYVYAPRSGVFDPAYALGDQVKKGQIAGHLYDQEEPWNKPVTLYFQADGLVVCVRTMALVKAGDCLVHLSSRLDG
jgi:predicted deacylase